MAGEASSVASSSKRKRAAFPYVEECESETDSLDSEISNYSPRNSEIENEYADSEEYEGCEDTHILEGDKILTETTEAECDGNTVAEAMCNSDAATIGASVEPQVESRPTGAHSETNVETIATVATPVADGTLSSKKLVRKRQRNPKNWKANTRKINCQQGNEYVSRRGKLVSKKCVNTTKDCMKNCKFHCSKHVTSEERAAVFNAFYAMTPNEKRHFIGKTTSSVKVKRPTTKNKNSRRKHSFAYQMYVGANPIRVCKEFYLGTLAISQKPIYNYHAKKDTLTDTPQLDKRGKHPHKHLYAASKQVVMDHINSFPRVESHYCRARTNKEYLEATLNVTKMYELYTIMCTEKNIQPVKLSYYRFVFNSEFNLEFHMPKKDRCDLCEEHKIKSNEQAVSTTLQEQYDKHVQEKNLMRAEREEDRIDKNKLVVCFDLENVITLPKTGTSSFFYKRKLNLYNLTGHASLTKQGYCAIWTEVVGGRAGNDIASAVMQILERVLEDHPLVTSITLWSDSCVPQNRNSHISFAIAYFLKEHPTITDIEMKFCVPGHSCVQEVDNMHSIIERAMLPAEFFSPITFIRVLLGARSRIPFRVIQMKATNFLNYKACAKHFSYNVVPFSKVSHLKFTQVSSVVGYKTSFADKAYSSVSVRKLEKQTRGRPSKIAQSATSSPIPTPPTILPIPRVEVHQSVLPKAKQDDLREMMKKLPSLDRAYYDTILKK